MVTAVALLLALVPALLWSVSVNVVVPLLPGAPALGTNVSA